MSNIYVDFDDVLCKTALEFTRVLEREFGKQVAFEDIHSFDLGTSFGLGPEEIGELMERVHEPDVLAAMEPVEGAVQALNRWTRSGYEVWIVTGRPAGTRASSELWLRTHGVAHARLDFVDKYGRTDPRGDKTGVLTLDQLSKMEFCLAVEDSSDMAAYLASRMRMPVAMLARPWNAAPLSLDSTAAARIARCKDWDEVLAKFPFPHP